MCIEFESLRLGLIFEDIYTVHLVVCIVVTTITVIRIICFRPFFGFTGSCHFIYSLSTI